MDAFSKSWKDLQEAKEALKQGRISLEELLAAVSVAKAEEAILGRIQKSEFACSKDRKQLARNLERKGLRDDGMLYGLTEEPELELVLCRDQNLVITREACKNRSGSPDHFEQCRQCPVDKTTRRVLVNFNHSPSDPE